MGKIEWIEAFSVNHAEIDEQHKKWIEIYNTMTESLGQTNIPKAGELARRALHAMYDYARYHFEYEKEYMEKIEYPDVVKHIRKHKDLEFMVYDMIRKEEEGFIILNSELVKIIKDWLLNHILTEDKKYSLFSAEKKL